MLPTSSHLRLLACLIVPIFVLAPFLSLNGELSAATIKGLYNTGLDENGNIQKDGQKDAHYKLVMPGSRGSKSPFKIPENKLPGGPNNGWIKNKALLGNSAWIGPNARDSIGPAGNYTYTLQFDLRGYILDTVFIKGYWSSDNSSDILINGIFTRNSIGSADFDVLTEFLITDGFKTGINTLEFVVKNEDIEGGPTGLLVSHLKGEGTLVPIPAAVWLLGSALIALALAGVKKWPGGRAELK